MFMFLFLYMHFRLLIKDVKNNESKVKQKKGAHVKGRNVHLDGSDVIKLRKMSATLVTSQRADHFLAVFSRSFLKSGARKRIKALLCVQLLLNVLAGL